MMHSHDPLLQRVPKKLLSVEQKGFRPAKKQSTLPIYRFLEEPTHLIAFE